LVRGNDSLTNCSATARTTLGPYGLIVVPPDQGAVARLGRENLMNGWAQLLTRFRWDHFCTLTFAHDVYEGTALRRVRRFFHYINRKQFGVRYTKRADRIYAATAMERGTNERIHFHSLLGGTSGLTGRWLNRLWESERVGGGFARCFPFRKDCGAEEYCAKYTVKGGSVDIYGDPLHCNAIDNRATRPPPGASLTLAVARVRGLGQRPRST